MYNLSNLILSIILTNLEEAKFKEKLKSYT